MTKQYRAKIVINGIVQGVGFRPLIYRYAIKYKLVGTVLNDAQGVTIELQGEMPRIQSFIHHLKTAPPPLARIDKFTVHYIPLLPNCSRFEIIHSQNHCHADVPISTDINICRDCNDEIMDPTNRHFQYPFTNCTNCGPRYTLINSLPYDRENTSMATFSMCEQCTSSYQDPLDRRYHAQPVSCPQCGPHLTLTKSNGHIITEKEMALEECVAQLQRGKIVAIKGLGGFHLFCDATNDDSVATLRLHKQRPQKPLAVMVDQLKTAKQLVLGNKKEWQLLQSEAAPITLMQKQVSPSIKLSKFIAPNVDKLGLFLPYTPLYQLLLKKLARPVVATSANLNGQPIITNGYNIQKKLGHMVDFILDHDRDILNACDDSVVQVIENEIQVMRLARGYAPLTIPIQTKQINTTLAVGAQQKSTLAFGFGYNIVISPHIGDLCTIETEDYFQSTIETFQRLYHLTPNTLAHDKHPEYTSTQWVMKQPENSTRNIAIQHHYAHVLSVMAANQYTGSVLGFSFDGTGLGDDGSLWGGEAIIADINGFTPLCQLQSFKLIGKQQAIKDPRRVLLSILLENHSLDEIKQLDLAAFSGYHTNMLSNLQTLWANNHQCINSSSMGRLFDAIACALSLIEKTQFEGQAGMLLETMANRANGNSTLRFTLINKNNQWDTACFVDEIISAISAQPLNESRVAQISVAFFDALSEGVLHLAKGYKSLPIVLCGGVFQNRYFHELCLTKLKKAKHQVLSPGFVPINDGGISLGQLWYAVHQVDNSLN